MTLHALFLAATLIAQMAPGKPGDVKVNQVNDRRGKSFARLSVTVEMPGVRTWDVASSRVLLRTAVDDVGTDLIKASDEEPQLEMNQRQDFGKDEKTAPAMMVTVEMKNPPRSAKMIKEVRGDIELYMPAKDANGVATIQKFLSQSGKSLSDRALKANNVDVTIISKSQFETMKKAAMDKYRAEQKANGAEGDDLEERVKNFAEYDYVNPEEGDVLLKVNDPNKRIESITYVDPKGETKRVSMRDKNGIVVLSTWGDKPQPDWAMKVNMKTAKNVTRVPFALTNVPLP